MKKSCYFIVLALAILMSACGSYKQVPYYQDLDRSKGTKEEIQNYSPNVIQPGDLLGINVTSQTPEKSAIYNYSSKDYNPNAVAGYLVDEKGEVQLPNIGTLKVSGLTNSQLQQKMNQLLLVYYKDPVTNVRIMNFKVAVYGDVLRPDVYTIKDEKINVMQALALAGDLTITGIRKNVVLIREENGIRNFYPIDLTSKNLFHSPYFYLKSNDQLYVTPDKTKYATVNNGRTASIILSALSVVAIVFSALYR